MISHRDLIQTLQLSAKYNVNVIPNLSYLWKQIIWWVPSCLVWASHLCPLTVKCQNNANLQLTVIHLLMFKWMRARWTSDPCYTFYGVDGSDCSFLIYLSEVEWFCPPLAGRNQSIHPTTSSPPKRQVSAWNGQYLQYWAHWNREGYCELLWLIWSL